MASKCLEACDFISSERVFETTGHKLGESNTYGWNNYCVMGHVDGDEVTCGA